MTGILTRNIGWKLLSLGAAVLLWISVASEPEMATLQSVPVQYRGVPRDLEISSNVAESVFLEMRGAAGRLRDLRNGGPAVVLDFANVHDPGERTFTIDENNVSLPRGIQLVRAIPAQLRFRFERRMILAVPIEVRFSAPREGYVIDHYIIDPPKLTISGPARDVEKTRTVVTDPIDITGVVSSHRFRVNTYLAEPQAQFESSSHVTVDVVVKKEIIMGKQLFGTDGVRGVAGEYPLDPRTVHAFGMALGATARHLNPDPEIVMGMDTRESGPWLVEQIAGGLADRGVRARLAGVITTPGIAYLTKSDTFAAGVIISASHNPYQDNGIKVFGRSGYKLPDQEEHAIEQEIFRLLDSSECAPKPVPLQVDPGLDQRYIDYLLSTVTARFDGVRMVVDCGNGAASHLAAELFRRNGARVHAISCQPNGRNINLNCGALHVETLARAVVEQGADLGVAFDGDADRAIFVSADGKIVDGDAVLLLAARWLKAGGHLAGDVVVSTVMSNLGLERALAREGIRMLRTPVGDKYVLEEMVRVGAALGGEQSGHVIFGEYATTGDGMLTALRVVEIMRCAGAGLDDLTRDLEIFPQRLYNVRVRVKKPLTDLLEVEHEISACEKALGSSGRVLVRFSGTEPLVRVMVEAEDLAQVEEYGQRIARAIDREIGVK